MWVDAAEDSGAVFEAWAVDEMKRVDELKARCAGLIEARANADAPLDKNGVCGGCGTDPEWRKRVGRHEWACSRAMLLELAAEVRAL